MAVYYYEIADDRIESLGGKYFYSKTIPPSVGFGLYQHYSTRIWILSIDGLRFYKNKYMDLYDTCGLLSKDNEEEFLWVKLKCGPAKE